MTNLWIFGAFLLGYAMSTFASMGGMTWTKINAAPLPEAPPTEPVVSCLSCHQSFVWWVHPVQLCDDCIDREFTRAALISHDDASATPLIPRFPEGS
jgi:hypothetical protein